MISQYRAIEYLLSHGWQLSKYRISESTVMFDDPEQKKSGARFIYGWWRAYCVAKVRNGEWVEGKQFLKEKTFASTFVK